VVYDKLNRMVLVGQSLNWHRLSIPTDSRCWAKPIGNNGQLSLSNATTWTRR